MSKEESFFTTHQDWSFPVPSAYGPGRINEIADHCLKLGIKHPLIVTDKGSSELPFLETLGTYLSKSKIPYNFFIQCSKKKKLELAHMVNQA